MTTLRRPNRTLVLWVDAVCINQRDISERNSQVRNNLKTYTEVSSVIVWLGTDSPTNDRPCLDFFAQLARLIAAGNADQQPDASWRRRFEINRMVSEYLDDTNPMSMISFLGRPWFRRRWTVQEVVLAKEVVVHCGTSSIPWAMFELAMMNLFENDKGVFSAEHRTTMRTMVRMRHADSENNKCPWIPGPWQKCLTWRSREASSTQRLGLPYLHYLSYGVSRYRCLHSLTHCGKHSVRVFVFLEVARLKERPHQFTRQQLQKRSPQCCIH